MVQFLLGSREQALPILRVGQQVLHVNQRQLRLHWARIVDSHLPLGR